ncbi:MAG: AAA family ATPase [Candidatus Saccharimonadaceae bacterium]
MEKQLNFFERLGVYGFGQIEPLIIAALVSEDPILLIGKAGTGKTFLLNSISEAMGLEHRHYNASLISFDDLVGFPYPSKDGRTIEFLPTPATIWGAESVLVDEISRCKPETQNKFFSIIHEKRAQGMLLSGLRYRWAAMNPFSLGDAEPDELYEGSQPLDQALADRFAFIIEVPDWPELTTREQELVIYPAGESAISDDGGSLRDFVERVKPEFKRNILHPLPEIVSYARLSATLLTEAGYRMSPRRARLLSRNLTALISVAKKMGNSPTAESRKNLYKLALRWSLPHRAWKGAVPEHVIDSVHAEVTRIVFSGTAADRWISEFLLSHSMADKLSRLFETDADMDTKSLAVIQMLARGSQASAAAFSFCAFPLLSEGKLLNEEAMNEMAGITRGILDINGKLEWREATSQTGSIHPSWSACLQVLDKLPLFDLKRKKRARQLFLYLLTQGEAIDEPSFLEDELNDCFQCAKKHAATILN